MKCLSVILFWACAALLVAAPAEKPPLAHASLGVANGCFVESVAFLDHWKETQGEAWARLLQWGAREEDEIVAGHAVAVCEVRGALWCWDINYGWTKLELDPAQREHPEQVSTPILKKYPRVTARYPTFRYDFAQTPSSQPPAAQPAAASRGLRDASLIAERLARHRPVNLVRFTYGATEAEKQESTAVVFVFHGRFCIYVPEVGTVPFRVRTGVEYLRITQELLRRMLPGVTGVRKVQAAAN